MLRKTNARQSATEFAAALSLIRTLLSPQGLFVLGEANFSDHGANRLGASALMQGLADGYFIIPYTIGDYLAQTALGAVATDAPEVIAAEREVGQRTEKLL